MVMPCDLKIVGIECLISGNETHPLMYSLSNQKSIKWIFVHPLR